MQGKIFEKSTNLYQDQARILFDYYYKAAEKIVKEERELEDSISQSEKEIEFAKKKKKIGIIIISVFPLVSIISTLLLDFFFLFSFGDALIFLLIFLLGSLKGIIDLIKANKTIKTNESKILAFQEAFQDIRRDYSVKKMGVVYVPVATKVPFEGKSFLVDHTGQVGESEFKMSVVHKPEELLKSLTTLENAIKEVPLVEQAQEPEEVDTSDYSTSIQNVTLYDYMGTIDRQIRNVRYLLNDSDTVALSLPVIQPESDTADFIKEFATSNIGDKPIVSVFNVDSFKEKLDSLYSLNDMRKSFEKSTNENQVVYYKRLIKRLAESVHVLSKTKITSSNKIIDYSNMILSTVLKASFNQYSPSLEQEEIERIRSASFDFQDSVDDYTPFSLKSSSRVKYDLFSTAWIAEDQSRTSMPFGVHQIQEEVLAPVIQNLMAENRIERLKVYNSIKDQKMQYLNTWHRDTEDFYGRNRGEANDLMNRMREANADYVRCLNTYKALQETQNAMRKKRTLESTEVSEIDESAETIASFELQATQFQQKQEEFSEYFDRLKENITEKANEFGYIPYYEATLRDREFRDMAQSTDQLQELEPRRKKLIPLSPYIAAYAKLPPMPHVEQKLYDDFSIDLLKEAAMGSEKELEINPQEEIETNFENEVDINPEEAETNLENEADINPEEAETNRDDEADLNSEGEE